MESIDIQATHFLGEPGHFSVEQVERARPMLRDARSTAMALFGTATLSGDPEKYRFSALKRTIDALPDASIPPETKSSYSQWRQLPNSTALQQSQNLPIVNSVVMAQLLRTGDPALMLINRLEVIRIQDYSSLALESGRLEAVQASYNQLLSGLHARTIASLGQAAVA